MIKVSIDSFSPREGKVGTTIEAFVNALSAPKAPPNSLYTVGGLFTPITPGATPVATSDVEIIDNQVYTTFSIRAPLGLHPDATYTFSFSLFPKSEGKDKNIYILDSGAEGFKVSASSGPSITNILPQTVHRANLLTTVFQIYGMDLDRLNKTYSPHILSTPMVYLNFLDIEKDHAKLKIIAVPVAGISPGNYMVEFMDKDSRPVFCRTKLTVIG